MPAATVHIQTADGYTRTHTYGVLANEQGLSWDTSEAKTELCPPP